MDALIMALDQATLSLKQLTSATLTADQIEITKNAFSGLNIEALIQNQLRNVTGTGTSGTHQVANEINKKADGFNDELQRIKKIKNTLNLDALEPVITAASHFIRPIFQFTASLQDGEMEDE